MITKAEIQYLINSYRAQGHIVKDKAQLVRVIKHLNQKGCDEQLKREGIRKWTSY